MNLQDIEPSIIIALFSLLGTIVMALLQLRKDKAEIKRAAQQLEIENSKAGIDAVESIADIVLKMHKQEIDTLRAIAEDLKSRNKYLEEELTNCQVQLKERNKMIDEIEQDLRSCAKDKSIAYNKIEELMRIVNCEIDVNGNIIPKEGG
jgi:chromosome segregation ATPase